MYSFSLCQNYKSYLQNSIKRYMNHNLNIKYNHFLGNAMVYYYSFKNFLLQGK